MTPMIREIATDDDPVLKIIAKEIDPNTINSAEMQQLFADMEATMYSANGIGLAAPQIRVSLRVMVFYLPAARDDIYHKGVPVTVLINPTVEPEGDEKINDYEGCLSVPGKRGKVLRYKKIRYTGLSPSGEVIDRVAEGWHARLVQHEFDHLNGILYPELMTEEDKLLTLEEWKAITTSSNTTTTSATTSSTILASS